MSTLNVEWSSLTSAIFYLGGMSHNPSVSPVRNLMMEANYQDPSRFIIETKRRMASASRTQHEICSIRLSFSREEFDPHKLEDQYLALQASKSFTDTWLAKKAVNRPYLITLQADGVSGLLHSHVYICNPGSDGKGIPHGFSALKMQDLNDKVMHDFMIDHDRSTDIQDGLAETKAKRDRNSNLAAEHGHLYGHSKKNARSTYNKEEMRRILQQAMKVTADRDEFMRWIRLQGIYLNRRANSTNGNLWLRDDGTFRKSLSLEYKGTKARTATLLGMDLEEVDRRLRKNKLHRQQKQQRQTRVEQQVDKNQKKPTILIELPKVTKKVTSDEAPLPRIHVDQKQLLQKKYQQLIELNQRLGEDKLSKQQREHLLSHKQDLVFEVTELESAVFVTETRRSERRLQQQSNQRQNDEYEP
jgi:hypothetical protein